MVKSRVVSLGRGLAVTLFLLQSLGVLLFAFGAWLSIGLSEFDGPPVAEHTQRLLAMVTLAAVLALVAASVVASGLLDQGFVITRLLVIVSALAVNVYGLVDQSPWYIELARNMQEYRSVGFDSGDLAWTAGVALRCALGSAVLVVLAIRAVRSRPKLALLLDA